MLQYWTKKLAGCQFDSTLPTDSLKTEHDKVAKIGTSINGDVFASLSKITSGQDISLFVLLLTVIKILIYKLSDKSDITLLVPAYYKAENTNHWVITRDKVNRSQSFQTLLYNVRQTIIEAYEHQDYALEKLLSMFGEESYAGLSSITLYFDSLHSNTDEIDNKDIDIKIKVNCEENQITLETVYNSSAYMEFTIKALLGLIIQILKQVVKHPRMSIEEIELVSEKDWRLLEQFNATDMPLPQAQTVLEMFEAQVMKEPNALAVVSDAGELTYSQLHARANHLARYLREVDVRPEGYVGIFMEQSPDLLVAILAVLQAGGAYVPLDPAYPQERIAFLLEDAHISVLLTQETLRRQLPPYSGTVLTIDRDWPLMVQVSSERVDGPMRGKHLAYVIYTSGSTGKPKGVQVTHENLLHSTCARQRYYPEPVQCFLLLSSFAFDSSIAGIFWTLSDGGTLFLPRSGSQLDPAYLLDLMSKHAVSHLLCLPSLYATLLEQAEQEQLTSLRAAIVAGEACSSEVVRRHYSVLEQATLYNEYGPTEGTVWCTVHRCRAADGSLTVPIGRPIPNMQVYLLNAAMQQVPVGMPGEIYLGGPGITRGYGDRPDLTAERFVPHPFCQQAGDRLYRTGDLARYREDGTLEFRGRVDHQIKIRGFRIEPGEIEAVLQQCPALQAGTVAVFEHAVRGKQLVAYLVAKDKLVGRERSVAKEQIKAYLNTRLPNYMIPSTFIWLDALPLTSNGKIDRKALPAPTALASQTRGEEPRGGIEEALSSVWSQVLGLPSVGIHDNFFELGGHSLLATQLMSRIRTALQIEVPLQSVVANPTIAELAAEIDHLRRQRQGLDLLPIIVPQASEPDFFPLSYAQQRLWFIHQLEPESTAYNIRSAVRLSGPLIRDALEKSLSEIVRRHEILRTTFTLHADQPVQIIHPFQEFSMTYQDLTCWDAETAVAEAQQMLQQEALRPFDLEAGPLLRASLYRLNEQEHIFFFGMHHIVADGWSNTVFLPELLTFYTSFVQDIPPQLADLPIQYKDFALWQHQWLQGSVLEAQLQYWKEQLRDIVPLRFPTDRPASSLPKSHGGRTSRLLSRSLSEALKAISLQEQVTLFMTLLAGFQILLYRYTGQEDICVGTPTANRNRDEIENLIGFFVNTLILRTNLSGNPSFYEVLQRIKHTTLEAYTHQDAPFEKIVEILQPERDLGRSPLFQILFLFQNTPQELLMLPDIEVTSLELASAPAKFDLTFLVDDTESGLNCIVEYDQNLFDKASIDRFLSHWEILLTSIMANPEQELSYLSLLSPGERQRVLVDFSGVVTDYPENSCIHHLFEEQVRQNPDAIALVQDEMALSYRILNERANQLAHYLQQQGVGTRQCVGICLDRSIDLITALLATFKAGGIYVPLDHSYPENRLAFMLEDAQISFLLTRQDILVHFPRLDIPVLCFDAADELLQRQPVTNPISQTAATDLAYIIYTSGSTGVPKGVAVQHRCVVRLVKGTNYARFSRHETFLLLASISFDASMFEIGGSLIHGARLVLFPENPPSLTRLRQVLLQEQVTTLWLTAGLFHQMVETHLDALMGVSQLLVGGDVISVSHVQRVLQAFPAITVINGYGPTENTVFTCAHSMHSQLTQGNSVPIGRPIANTTVYVLDTELNPVPIGVVGELYTGGAGLAVGYLNRPDLTAERFVPHPFSSEPGARLYRTGDHVRYRPDGTLEFLGRRDLQVKLRGFRIELEEIESVLRQHPGVSEALVVLREDIPGDQRLVAYIVATVNVPSSQELRAHLSVQVPSYMQPSAFVLLEALPLSSSGKPDRRTLPAPHTAEHILRDAVLAPRSPMEELLAGIWAEVLGIEYVGVHESFFELGGHSLLATRVVSRMSKALGKEVPLRQLFEAPTVASLAKYLATLSDSLASPALPPCLPISREQDLPLSFAQQRLWFLDQLMPNHPFYNVYSTMRLKGPLRLDALSSSVKYLVQRHESLRTTFVLRDGRPLQVISPASEISVPLIDLQALPSHLQQQKVLQIASQEVRRPFDLARGPLLRLTLLRLNAQEHVLLLTMHHIICDEWSIEVLLDELTRLYDAASKGQEAKLPDLPIQYADFAFWQRQWLQGERHAAQLAYWTRQLQDAPPLLDLPTDHPHPPVQRFQGATLAFGLTAPLSRELRALSRREGVTLFMTLLTAFQTLLFRYSGQADVLIGSPIANRTLTEVEGLIGFFVNTLVLRTDLSGNPSFRDLLARVREMALGAYAHQDLPFEQVIDVLHLEREMGHQPLVQVFFVLQNAIQASREFSDLQVEPLQIDNETTKFELSLIMAETAEGLRGEFQYDTELFNAATIERMRDHLQCLLESIVDNADMTIMQLPLLPQAERYQVLQMWNATAVAYPQEYCLHELMSAQSVQYPDAIALVSGEQHLSYQCLERSANQLAHVLRTLGVGPECQVGLCMERSVEMVLSLLAILKAGGAYVPLDPNYSQERLSFVLHDARISLLLTRESLMERLVVPLEVQAVCLESIWERVELQQETAPVSGVSPDNLAYVIYTSGSTGRPKGTLLHHRGLCNLVEAQRIAIAINSEDHVLQFASLSFDASIWEIIMALLSGATLYLAKPNSQMTGLTLPEDLRNQAITVTLLPPSVLAAIPAQGFPSLHTVISGGEACSADLVARWGECHRFLNAYGPTEATVCATIATCDVQSTERPTIGRPIANTQVYILDTMLQSVPIGVPGELYVAGIGLARGYLNRPELTAECFIPNPFSDKPGDRLYKTGDFVRFLPNGEIEFMGRKDTQVKIRGFRIECGEIENILNQHPDIKESVILPQSDLHGDKYLAAYLVTRDGESLSVPLLRQYLQQKLPEYMLPAHYHMLHEFSLTTSGKVDRQALLNLKPVYEAREIVQPADALEQSLLKIWEETLNQHPLGMTDNFFDLGGHSIVAIRLMSRIYEQLGCDLPLSTLFLHPTVVDLATIIRQQTDQELSSIAVPLQSQGRRPPFFCVHPSGGTVFRYQKLAHLLGEYEQPFYGFQTPELEDDEYVDQEVMSLESIASTYIAAMRQIQPQGPYQLGGWSLGGSIAFEMAQQLRLQNEEVALLALIDSRVPFQCLPPEERIGEPLAERETVDLDDNTAIRIVATLFQIPLPEPAFTIWDLPTQSNYIWQQAKDAGLISNDVTFHRFRRLMYMHARNYLAERYYQPRIYPGQITYFRASAGMSARARMAASANLFELSLGWRALTTQEIQLHVVPGNHASMFEDPNVQILAAHLNRYLITERSDNGSDER